MQERLRARAALLQRIRAFFLAREVLEVSTPILSLAGTTDPNIGSLTTHVDITATHQLFYLHTSPEFAMKRLLAAGSGCIFQICPVFRNSDQGRYHRPEFTMLEWYRVGWDHFQLMEEMRALLQTCLPARYHAKPALYLTYHQALLQHTGLNLCGLSVSQCRDYCRQQQLQYPDSMQEDLDEWLDLIMSHFVMSALEPDRLVFLHDYPASQAALARVRHDASLNLAVAERFEVFVGGVELANGFHELTDPVEQLRRFQQDNQKRKQQAKESINIDMKLIDALRTMPACAGVALGVDRLLMLCMDAAHIDEVMTEPVY